MPNILFTTLGFSKSVELKCKLPMISVHIRFAIIRLTRETQVKILADNYCYEEYSTLKGETERYTMKYCLIGCTFQHCGKYGSPMVNALNLGSSSEG